jgi:hypothetical protein
VELANGPVVVIKAEENQRLATGEAHHADD